MPRDLQDEHDRVRRVVALLEAAPGITVPDACARAGLGFATFRLLIGSSGVAVTYRRLMQRRGRRRGPPP
jgi:hypothetical protein